ncbi:hydrogenase expression/formation protein HypE [Marinobacter santoriniensis NKSG1]|uniref:Hydrogenase expression/formation protein HypE n=1 Tax=Marinobacter santoriniensis NKSG1 TaxID=1288826 RepID=M7DEW5_9GAMM|nr:hydrogenase expression/formation protein HypE [Marinobacter santoriniensis]EMP56212.1 hydrogenase expression/formation protein HypE [Marinobacter santoriniensis NKSG1]
MSNISGDHCPLAHDGQDVVKMAHGGGGRAMAQLLDSLFRPAFDNPWLERQHDGAVLDMPGSIAFTTDSYVVRPLFFPGSDIGAMAVHGTVNDIAMCGAEPQYLSAGFILEEGLPLATLRQVVESMATAARATGVRIVTGDLKVVERGKADGLYINTAGVGRVVAAHPIEPGQVQAGDRLLLSGDIGRHGIAVMAAREKLDLESAIESDCASIAAPVLALLNEGISVRCFRDLTRGGLASGVVEVAETAGLAAEVREADIPVREDVSAVCELLGLDPLHVANEGRFIAVVAPEDVDRAIAILRRHGVSEAAVEIGQFIEGSAGRVTAQSLIGGSRIVDRLSGEQLPRIC